MSRRKEVARSDLEECKAKVLKVLREYNSELISADEWHSVLIRDKDTEETVHWRE